MQHIHISTTTSLQHILPCRVVCYVEYINGLKAYHSVFLMNIYVWFMRYAHFTVLMIGVQVDIIDNIIEQKENAKE